MNVHEYQAKEILSSFGVRIQRGKVAADAATVFLVLIPVSTMAGDYEADVARYKGEKQALERTLANKTC